MKRWIAWTLMFALLLTGLTGCKSPNSMEQSAAADQYVPDEPRQESGDAPTVITDWEIVTPPETEQEDTPDEETPVVDAPDPEPPEEEETSAEEEPVTYEDGNKLKIVSYNVRCKSDGTGKTIAERSVRFKKVMDQYDPDIMGLQEVVPEWLEYLKRDFSTEYGYINQWRAQSDEESTPIFWKKDKFTLVESGHFWLSDNPDVESKAESWGAEYYRICMWVKLKIKATGKTLLFYNTHFDTAKEPRVPSANLIIERATEKDGFTQYPVFCTGDFNMRRSQDSYKAMCSKFKDVNAELENLKTPTSNGYHDESKEGYLIDYCFYSPGNIQPLKYQIIDEYVDDGYVSDHCGLYIEAALA